MRSVLLVAIVLVSGCALKGDGSACSDPLGLYTDRRYQPCCVAHDRAYLRGGEEADRLAADYALRFCVATYSLRDADSMFTAVRLFGRDRFTYTK